MQHLFIDSDPRGKETFIRNASDSVVYVSLSAGTIQTVPVPTGANKCFISGIGYYVSTLGSFTLPASAGVSAFTAEFELAGLTLHRQQGTQTPVTNLYFLSTETTFATVAFFS